MRGAPLGVGAAARRPRRNLTPAELTLWPARCRGQLEGLHVRWPHALGPFVRDRSCPALRAVAAVDGPIDAGQREHAALRTEHLGSFGFEVLCFTNDEVYHDLTAVLNRVR